MFVVGSIDAGRVAQLTAFVAGQRITDHVVRALEPEGLAITEVVEMDEFTIDLVVRFPDGLCLVYDTT